ncbi:2,4-dienoyl-CoA reductase [Granulicatella balaenopterae]|uniref:2,4-dienoyl-CoA reductase n=2 Tax=Granulicatella balaenopterae TaxID=137733 RepID=A0A1H9GWR8_9LACT|nr:NADH-dependent flavin oxidoreductase [Granulicatella balaenopterae]SEQ54531.1 2,4-dienoyl-CoA reductase [Granulicatella balaenopterae]
MTEGKLFQALQLPNGVVLKNRFVLSPMITNSSTQEGFVTQADIDYAYRRADAAALQITGAAYIEEYGQLFEYGFSSAKDEDIVGLTELAKAMKAKGAKAILQLTHAGRFASHSLKKYGFVYGPSAMKLQSPIVHEVKELTHKHIQQLVIDYQNATSRAIKAGFDGVEISSAQRLLMQAFFSPFSNKRHDEYGRDSLENRARFALEVLRGVNDVIKKEAPKGFILGFRATPEETRGSQVGYSVEEFITLVEWILELADIQYLAIASWGHNVFRNRVRAKGAYEGQLVTEIIWRHFFGRLPIMATGGINTPEKVAEALKYADFVGSASPLVVDPEFLQKMETGRQSEINFKIKFEDLASLKIPEASFKDIVPLMDYGESIPKESRELFRSLITNYHKESLL